jgi:hypothetical protein
VNWQASVPQKSARSASHTGKAAREQFKAEVNCTREQGETSMYIHTACHQRRLQLLEELPSGRGANGEWPPQANTSGQSTSIQTSGERWMAMDGDWPHFDMEFPD